MVRNNDELIAMLREARAGKSEFNRTALLRPLMDEIEAAQAAGVSLKNIRETLAKGGIDMPLATLKTILYRHRQKQGRNKKSGPGVQTAPVPSLPSKTVPQNTTAPAVQKTGIERLNEAMRSKPDLNELARLAKEIRKESKT